MTPEPVEPTSCPLPNPPGRPSTPATPFQGYLAGWMAANQPGTPRTSPPLTQPKVQVKKEEAPVDTMEGGWRFEGKEKPVTPVVCTRCQWEQRNEQMSEPDKSSWCESCLEGKPGPGHMPTGVRPPVVSRAQDIANLNQTFFG